MLNVINFCVILTSLYSVVPLLVVYCSVHFHVSCISQHVLLKDKSPILDVEEK